MHAMGHFFSDSCHFCYIPFIKYLKPSPGICKRLFNHALKLTWKTVTSFLPTWNRKWTRHGIALYAFVNQITNDVLTILCGVNPSDANLCCANPHVLCVD
eukprot:Selendium_serpulae@DN4144_c0_g1_i2.p1